ncbi:hypothetical protein IW262DRAFT_1263299 [Armillaria fumosa]|nr:hypothetical protein IW262DRAFT_1263299 [Armillaria fumosa]
MGFWVLKIACGFVCSMPKLPDGNEIIFFFEALCVCSAIHWVTSTMSAWMQRCVMILTDNMNTMDIFNSLRASPMYNPILKSAVDTMIHHNIDLRVLHIPGSENDVVDALSHSEFSRAHNLVPRLLIISFIPPHGMLGASSC